MAQSVESILNGAYAVIWSQLRSIGFDAGNNQAHTEYACTVTTKTRANPRGNTKLRGACILNPTSNTISLNGRLAKCFYLQDPLGQQPARIEATAVVGTSGHVALGFKGRKTLRYGRIRQAPSPKDDSSEEPMGQSSMLEPQAVKQQPALATKLTLAMSSMLFPLLQQGQVKNKASLNMSLSKSLEDTEQSVEVTLGWDWPRQYEGSSASTSAADILRHLHRRLAPLASVVDAPLLVLRMPVALFKALRGVGKGKKGQGRRPGQKGRRVSLDQGSDASGTSTPRRTGSLDLQREGSGPQGKGTRAGRGAKSGAKAGRGTGAKSVGGRGGRGGQGKAARERPAPVEEEEQSIISGDEVVPPRRQRGPLQRHAERLGGITLALLLAGYHRIAPFGRGAAKAYDTVRGDYRVELIQRQLGNNILGPAGALLIAYEHGRVRAQYTF